MLAGWLTVLVVCCTRPLPVLAQTSAIRSMQAALTHTSDSTRYVDLLNQLALQYQYRQLDTCFVYLTQSRAIAQRLHYRQGEATAYLALGNHYAYRDNSYLSFRFYLESLRLYRELNDSAGICQLSSRLAVYYQYQGQHREAVQHLHQAIQIARRLHNDTVFLHLLDDYYFIYGSDTTHRTDAEEALQTANKLAIRLNDEGLLLYTGILQASVLMNQGATIAAEQQLNKYVHEALAKGYIYHAMFGYAQMADDKAKHQQADSLQYLQQVVKLAMGAGYRELALPIVAALYAYYDAQHKRDSALLYSTLMLDINEKQEQSKTRGELDYIDYYLQEKKLRQLQLEHDYQQQLLDRRTMGSRYRYMLIIFLTVLLLLMVLLLADVNRSYRYSRKNATRLGEKNREISEKNVLLRAQDDFKNKLISLIAHDFRSPLNHIIDITNLLKDRSLNYEEAAALFRKLENSSQYTLHVFDNIMRWIRSQLSGFVYHPQPCAVAAMLQGALLGLQDNCAEKSLQVIIQVPPELTVQADPEMLQFIHRNLLHNAVKFSAVGAAITVTAKTNGAQVTITVTDEGRGIPEGLLPTLFEYRKRDPDPRQKGAGLALIICKDFMDKMGGTIAVENHPGKGAAFSYTL